MPVIEKSPEHPLDLLIREARGWLADCDDGLAIETMRETTVIGLVHRYFEGGWQGFVAADPSAQPNTVAAEIGYRYGQQFADMIYPGQQAELIGAHPYPMPVPAAPAVLPWPVYRPMSPEEQDYIDYLDPWLRPLAIFGLQTYNAARMEDFIGYLRARSTW